MLARKMREQILADNKIAVSDAEVKDFYEKNKDGFKQPERLHLEQIFISSRKGPRDPVDSTKKEQAHQKIEQALKRVQAGENFQAVAKAVSEAPDKDNGGDMGMIPAPKLPPFYVKAAASMRPGDISGILESEYGFHFIKLVESAEASDVDPEKATPFVRSLLGSQRGDKAVQDFCKPILDNPNAVEIYLQLEKTLSSYPGFEDLLKNKNQADTKAQGANADNSPAKAPASETKPKTSSKKSTKR
ncbi:MAG: peptidylprolyl isomerase [Candidatus Hydrogenedentes bacterium]|nr:peptidylprolyl isomerase [Candidatus Hydrogenedentota bacterium]